MYWILLIIGLIGLDQWTKWYFFINKESFDKVEIIKDFFYLTYLENRGAAFGILQNFRWFFIISTLVALVLMIKFFLKHNNKLSRLALSFLIAGALGNFIDRLFRGYVVDFLDFYPFGYDFPIFNVADICVNIGVALLFIFIIFIYKEPDKGLDDKSMNDQSSEVSGTDDK